MNIDSGSVCFTRPHHAAPTLTLDAHDLPRDVALALANALPFLRCGEESAVHAFGRRLSIGEGGEERAALAEITADETRHAAWLHALANALPTPNCVPEPGAMAMFFRGLLTRDCALHFARIAALDLAVCALLRPLAATHSPLRAAPAVATGFAAIRRDEARHVRVARGFARRLGLAASRQRELDLSLRKDLCELLAPVHPSLLRLGIREFQCAAA